MSETSMGDERRAAPIVWRPPDDAWAASRLADFARHVAGSGGPECGDYPDLLDWSLSDLRSFWGSFAEWFEVPWHRRPSTSLGSAAMPEAVWFPGATLNYAELALRSSSVTPDGVAIVGLSQTRDRVEMTWSELADAVARCRAGLVSLGVRRGDRVVALLPTIPETTVAFLAVASIGAVWSTCAPEFGLRAVTDRWSQIGPTVLLTVDGYVFGNRALDRRELVREIVGALPSLSHVVHVPYLDPDGAHPVPGGAGPARLSWDELLDQPASSVDVEPVPFDHPLYLLFSSGTTGLPKPIVHGHGGIALEHAKALALHYDLRPGERFAWFTTTGWMMWNFLASVALVGATAVLFDGNPAAPDLSTLWRLAADEDVDVFGISAPFVMACRKAGLRPGDELDLSRLRHVGSTGAPLPPEGFDWIGDAVGSHVQIGSMSGGTDVCTAFVGAAPTLPVRRGEITTRMLGCDVQAFRSDGTRCSPGETGELVITQPLPSMPVGFWGDDDGSRYRNAYFAEFPGVWHHGDWITFTADGACTITGRSDATLNRGGVRLGTSDFYTVVESLPAVADSLVVHLEDDAGGSGELILLLAMAEGHVLDDELVAAITSSLRTELSPRHVPDEIDAVPAIPRTLSGKKLEVPVKRMLLGTPASSAASRDSLADPAALDAIESWITSRGSR